MATWGSADYRQLERLRENLAKLQGADMDKFCTDVSRELAGRLLALVIPRTPVGRKPTLEQLGGKEAKATVKTKLRDAQGRLRTRSFCRVRARSCNNTGLATWAALCGAAGRQRTRRLRQSPEGA